MSSPRFPGAAAPTGRGDMFLPQVSFKGGQMAGCLALSGTPGRMTYGNLSSQDLSCCLIFMISRQTEQQSVSCCGLLELFHGGGQFVWMNDTIFCSKKTSSTLQPLSSPRSPGAAAPTGRGDMFLPQVSFKGGQRAVCQTCLAPLGE